MHGQRTVFILTDPCLIDIITSNCNILFKGDGIRRYDFVRITFPNIKEEKLICLGQVYTLFNLFKEEALLPGFHRKPFFFMVLFQPLTGTLC